jgi:hypothetical protein
MQHQHRFCPIYRLGQRTTIAYRRPLWTISISSHRQIGLSLQLLRCCSLCYAGNQFYNEGRKTMIVNRRTFNMRQGRTQEAIELVAKETAAERERSGYSGTVRIYTPNLGRFSQLAVEFE